MAELATLAGVDISTVSRALRGDARRVSASTMARIRELARELAYLPDANASSLRGRHSHVIGMLVPDLTDVVLANLFEAVSGAAASAGYLAVVTSTRGEAARRRAAVQSYLSHRVDGVILADAHLRNPVPEALATSGTPFVMAMRSGGRHPAVIADDLAGGRLAADHLLGLGHRTVCVVAGPRQVRTVAHRLRGFLDAFRRAGAPIPPSSVAHGPFGVEGGFRAMSDLLDTGLRPTAVFAMNDFNAIGAACALGDRGAVVGRDVALVGYNDITIGRYLQTPLTTVRIDHQSMGREAIGLLLRRIRGEPVHQVLVPPELVVRGSSMLDACPPADGSVTTRRAKMPNSS